MKIWFSDDYNPFDYIRPECSECEEQISSLIETIIGKRDCSCPFWYDAEHLFLKSIFYFTIYGFRQEERNMNTVIKLIYMLKINEDEDNKDSELDIFAELFKEQLPEGENNIGYRLYMVFRKFARGKVAKIIVEDAINHLVLFKTKIESSKEKLIENDFRKEAGGSVKMVREELVSLYSKLEQHGYFEEWISQFNQLQKSGYQSDRLVVVVDFCLFNIIIEPDCIWLREYGLFFSWNWDILIYSNVIKELDEEDYILKNEEEMIRFLSYFPKIKKKVDGNLKRLQHRLERDNKRTDKKIEKITKDFLSINEEGGQKGV